MSTPHPRIGHRGAAAGAVSATTGHPARLVPRVRDSRVDIVGASARSAGPAWHRARVHTGLVAAVVTAALLAAVAGVVVAVRDRPPGRVTLALAAAGSLLTVGQSVAAAVDLVQGRRPPET